MAIMNLRPIDEVMVGQKALRPTLVGMYNYVQPVVASALGICMGLDVFTKMIDFVEFMNCLCFCRWFF